VEEAAARSDVRLLLMSDDARAAVSSRAVQGLVERGLGVSVLTKAELGGLVGREEAGVLAILDSGLASAVKDAVALASLPRVGGRSDHRAATTETP
jgi:hypothetical protein